MEKHAGRRRSIGLAGSAIWLIDISALFIIWSLIAIGTPLAVQILIVSVIIISVLIIIGIITLRSAIRLPVIIEPRTPEEQQMGRRFARVAGAEVLAFILVNPVIGAMGCYKLMPSLNLIIVGIHFIPLAKIFRVPRYNITGILFCIIPLITLIAIPKTAETGHTLAWYVVPGISCGVVAILTAIAGLREAWKAIYK